MRCITHLCASAAIIMAASVPIAVPVGHVSSFVPTAAAQTQELGSVRVDLQAAVGQEWFDRIGDRTLELRRIGGIDPSTSEGQKALADLDIPARMRAGEEFPRVAFTTTRNGQGTFTGIETGVYLLTVADNPDTADARVSYAPTVVVVQRGKLDHHIAPKPQVLGIATESNTKCSNPGYIDATSPGYTVNYQYTASLPNPSTDGSIGVYELHLEFSRGQAVNWSEELQIKPVAATQMSWREKLLGRKPGVAEAQPVPRAVVTLTGAGESTPLQNGTDYTLEHTDTSITVSLTAAGRSRIAAVRAIGAHAAVHVGVSARTNFQGPWGSVERGETLGTLDTKATLRTDGMDALRTPVQVGADTHIKVVSTDLCFGAQPTPNPPVDPGITDRPGKPGHTQQPGTPGSSKPNAGLGTEQPAEPGTAEKPRGLASTGASVLGVIALGVALILLGLILRRRKPDDAAR